MKTAICLIREQPAYRADAFRNGLRSLGYQVITTWRPAQPGDVLVIWNRYGRYHTSALQAESVGATVLVAENGYLGRDAAGGPWYALAQGRHNGAGWWPRVAPRAAQLPSRAHLLPLRRLPWREPGGEVVILPQRGIGTPGIAMPESWERNVLHRLRLKFKNVQFRIRPHPGERGSAPALEDDLKNASAVVTWGSGAALKAIDLGIPAFYDLRTWIGAPCAAPISEFPERYTGNREQLYEDLAWAQWTVEEIASGLPFRYLLSKSQ